MPRKIQNFARSALVKAIIVNVGRAGAASLNVTQEIEYVRSDEKLTKILECLQKTPPRYTCIMLFLRNLCKNYFALMRTSFITSFKLHLKSVNICWKKKWCGFDLRIFTNKRCGCCFSSWWQRLNLIPSICFPNSHQKIISFIARRNYIWRNNIFRSERSSYWCRCFSTWWKGCASCNGCCIEGFGFWKYSACY